MEVRRSLNGKAALVIDSGTFVKFITIGGKGPEFGLMHFKDFYSNFNKVLPMTAEEALLSFLKAAKRAYRHNAEVINFILEKYFMKNLTEETLETLVSRYNSLCAAAGKKPRKTFDSKKQAIEAIEKLSGEVQAPSPEQIKAAEGQHAKRSTTMSEAEKKEAAEPKTRGKGIGKRAMELLIQGVATQEIIKTIKEEIPDANPTPATIAWYKNKLRQEGKLEKPVKKEKAEKPAKKEKAAAETKVETPEVEEVQPETAAS